MYTIGYDIGTRFIKVCLVKDGKITAYKITEPGNDISRAINDAYRDVLNRSGINAFRIKNSAATGFGNNFVKKTKLKIDIPRSLAMGAYHADNSVRTVIDTGGLFINIAQVGSNGKLADSIENERCAAGSGRFLETITRAVELPFDSITAEIVKSSNPFHITSNCSVFAESEVISRVNNGGSRADILNGLVHSLVSKIETMLGVLSPDGPVALTGGVSEIEGFRIIIKVRLKKEIIALPINNQIIPAYGAALLAAEK